MAQYDNMFPVTYKFPALNFVTGAGAYKLPIPRTARFARVLDLMVVCTTTFTQTTTGAVLQVGDGVTAAAFAQLSIGGLTSGNSITGQDQVGGCWRSNYLAQANPAVGTNGVLHDLTMTVVAPTGGTPAGVGDVYVIVGFDTINR